MPELPEVETIVQQLKTKLVGKKIILAEIFDKGRVDPAIAGILPVKVVEVWRRAKAIVIELAGKKFLFVQLRMTGHFHHGNEKSLEPFQKYELVRFRLSDKTILTHNSIRKFGGIWLLNQKQLDERLNSLGPEPLDLDLNEFKKMLSRRPKANIKTTLMDQNFVSGIGNIYAQEALYWSGIDVKRKCGDLSDSEIKKLLTAIKQVLRKSIKHHGTTVENYVHIEGSGGFQKFLAVYSKEKCPKKHKVEKINLGGRGTYYCPKCQK